MAFPYTVFGPGGQPYIVPLVQQPLVQQQLVATQVPVAVSQLQPQVQQPQSREKIPDYMSEDKLQEKCKYV